MAVGSRFNPGGLFRCCVETIIEDDRAEYVGRKMPCTYCDAPLVVIQGVKHLEWQWDRDADISLECIKRSLLTGEHSEDAPVEMSAEEYAKRVVIEDARRRFEE
jgi:hypothetical protein